MTSVAIDRPEARPEAGPESVPRPCPRCGDERVYVFGERQVCIGCDPREETLPTFPRAGQLKLLAALLDTAWYEAGTYLGSHPAGCHCPECWPDPRTGERLADSVEFIREAIEPVEGRIRRLAGVEPLNAHFDLHGGSFGRWVRRIGDFADEVYAAGGIVEPARGADGRELEPGPAAVELPADRIGHGRGPADALVFVALAQVMVRLADKLTDDHPEDCDCRWCAEEPEAVADIREDVRAVRWALNAAAGFIESSIHGRVLVGGPPAGPRDTLNCIAREIERLDAGGLPVRCRQAGTEEADGEGDEDEADTLAVVKPR